MKLATLAVGAALLAGAQGADFTHRGLAFFSSGNVEPAAPSAEDSPEHATTHALITNGETGEVYGDLTRDELSGDLVLVEVVVDDDGEVHPSPLALQREQELNELSHMLDEMDFATSNSTTNSTTNATHEHIEVLNTDGEVLVDVPLEEGTPIDVLEEEVADDGEVTSGPGLVTEIITGALDTIEEATDAVIDGVDDALDIVADPAGGSFGF